MPNLPILYSFRRCPYAIRARMAIVASNVRVEIREVLLAKKPSAMLACSIKGTVPVLILPDGSVIDESMDIMLWALNQHDPHHWLSNDAVKRAEINGLIEFNDTDFKIKLDHYKYADRFPAQSMETHRQQVESFLQVLNERLENNRYLTGDDITLADIALFPFIRQCAHVDKTWFYQTHYTNLQAWLDMFLENKLFSDVMTKLPAWQP
ncbi:MAG: glutathione S-transferase [Acidiferrobacterales bacterium]